VFSWQSGNEQAGVGVLSTSRFTSPISDYYEPAIVATRRIAIQALSTTGSMFGFTRPTDPECPLAYPESLREFQQKRLRLCDSDKQQRDQLLARRGGKTEAFGTVREAAIARVYRTYFLE
jgi:predicted Zn-dependent protease